MKFEKLFAGIAGLLVLATVIVLVDPAKQALADTQVGTMGKLLPTTGDFLNGNPVNVAISSASTNILLGGNSSVIAVQPGCGLAVFPYFVVTNAAGSGLGITSNLTIVFAISPWTNSSNPEVSATPVGTTLFTTVTNNLIWKGPMNGTNPVMAYAYLPWTNIAGSKITVASALYDGTNVGGLYISNIFWKQFAPQ